MRKEIGVSRSLIAATKGLVSIVVPCYFSSETLDELFAELVSSLESSGEQFEIILVDDGSSDDTWGKIKFLARSDTRVIGLRFTRNFGQHKAIFAGLKKSCGEWVIVMDADLQDEPKAIPVLLAKAREGGVDFVLARRISKQHSRLKRIGSRFFAFAYRKLTGNTHDSSIGNFGAYSRKVVQTVSEFGDRDFVLGSLVRWAGFKSSTVEILHRKRAVGVSSYSLRKLIELGSSVLIANTNRLLSVIVYFGGILSALSAFAAAYLIFLFLLGLGSPPGWASIMVTILLSTGALMTSLGVVAIYIGKIFDLAKSRPLYIVAEEEPFSRT